MSVILCDGLQKYYGRHLGARDVSFAVEQGEIFGFVGPNGAGKSTTIKMLLNFIFPTDGKAWISGHDVVAESRTIKTFTGYVPSDVRLYDHMTTAELLRRNQGFYGGDQTQEAKRLCDLFEMDTAKRFRELSMGNRKKAAIICALAAQPQLLILDEPANGLDPLMKKNLFDELKSQTRKGVTVFLSSHNLSEVEEYCNRVAFIKRGVILAVTDLDSETPSDKIVTLWGHQHLDVPVEDIEAQNGSKITFRYRQGAPELLKLIAQSGARDFTVENESLEDRFMNLYQEEEDA